MKATIAPYAPYILLICSLMRPSTYAADAGISGVLKRQARETIQKPEPAGYAENARRDVASRGVSIKVSETVHRSANAGNPAARSGQRAAARLFGGLIPRGSGSPLAGTHAYVSPVTIRAASTGPLTWRSAADHAPNRSDALTGVVHGLKPITAPADADRQLSKALAGHGVIGGAQAPGHGMLGGPVNSRTVPNASIDGSALRRRF
jgi:hypothetical protein